MWWKFNRTFSKLLSIVVSLIFVNHGADRIIQMTLDQQGEFPVFRYMHGIEIVIIGFFLMLVECNSPLFRSNVNIMYKPTPKTILILIFSIFLYTGTDKRLDFYLVFGMCLVMLVLSFYHKRPREASSI